jgi:hypothetical protein
MLLLDRSGLRRDGVGAWRDSVAKPKQAAAGGEHDKYAHRN